ncbi:MAG: glycosyltransferase [Candidatus Schekmanbacteria bacterium]|nr:glycosyltransferase [Candidatus Schekmanbacteria bacterium]
MGKISVIICTYNGAKRIVQTLESLYKQKLSCAEFEIIIIDNGSTDNTAQVIHDFKVDHPALTLFYHYEKQSGKSYALNKGLQESRGEILAFIDDDVIADGNWLFAIKKAFATTGAACLGGKVIPLWDNSCPEWLSGKASIFIPSFDWGDEIKSFTPPANFPCGTNMAFKRELVENIGLFDVNLGHVNRKLIGSEETDYCLRIFAGGGLLIYYPKAIIYHPLNERHVSKAYLRSRSFTQGTASAYIYAPVSKFSSLLFKKIKNISSKPDSPNKTDTPGNLFDGFYLQLKLIFYLGFLYGMVFKKIVPAQRKPLKIW